jgi:hypothetical protein
MLTSRNQQFAFNDALAFQTKASYLDIQNFIRDLAEENRVPPIWFEAAWTTRDPRMNTKCDPAKINAALI